MTSRQFWLISATSGRMDAYEFSGISEAACIVVRMLVLEIMRVSSLPDFAER